MQVCSNNIVGNLLGIAVWSICSRLAVWCINIYLFFASNWWWQHLHGENRLTTLHSPLSYLLSAATLFWIWRAAYYRKNYGERKSLLFANLWHMFKGYFGNVRVMLFKLQMMGDPLFLTVSPTCSYYFRLQLCEFLSNFSLEIVIQYRLSFAKMLTYSFLLIIHLFKTIYCWWN